MNVETLSAATVTVVATTADDDRPVVVRWPDPSPLEDWWTQVMGTTGTE
ncbi:hypothetical protein [Nocardia sp. alder85J]|nr:hypothetical protein [Nocardia sp. alder85J]MCX4092430.1 hypothetical protein [Nocardia sp. alder85J]